MRTVDGVDVLSEPDDGDVDLLLVGIGSMVATALAAAEKLTAEGHRVRSSTRCGRCPCPALASLAGAAGRVAVVEDNVVVGGHRHAVVQALRDAGLGLPVDTFGLPKRFLDHASRGRSSTRSG